ncbi:MAG: hypothetical protein IT450_15655 [Phycisphaerales bacterium]|nr:hypothetical protein [Phycisphaerales bacterium]
MNWLRRLFGAATILAAGSASAQPAVYTDLGTHTSTETFSQNVTLAAANDIQWFRIVLPAVDAADGYVDVWNMPSGLADNITDSEIGVYDSAGNLVASDDDDGPGLYSALSFGLTSPTRPAPVISGATTGVAFNGRDGGLGGGEYWVAVGRFNVTFGATGWTVTSAYTGTQRTTVLNFDIVPSGNPTNPSGVGTASPALGEAGSSFTATVVVTPGANPPSTGLAVTLDATAVGAGVITMNDDGGNSFSAFVTTDVNTPVANYALPFTITDAEGRTGGGNVNYNVIPPPPPNDDCTTAEVVGAGATAFNNFSATNDGLAVCSTSNKDIWYQYTLSADAEVRVDTCGSSFDTVLAVFDACGGTQIACNDDSCGLQSVVTFVAQGGTTVYIRVAAFGAAGAGGAGTLTVTELAPPYVEPGDADDTPGTADTPQGSGVLDAIVGNFDSVADADVYLIAICDAANFSATTVGGTTQDTQLFLFNDQGYGVTFNDDSTGLQSRITSQFVPGNGNYYLGVSRYDNDPIDAGALALWIDTPFGTERQPDGPGAANPWVDFDSTSATAGGAYRITLTGACYVSGGGGCSGDLDGDNDRDISDLAILLSQFGLTGGTFSADVDTDGDVDISDLAIMLSVFGIPC